VQVRPHFSEWGLLLSGSVWGRLLPDLLPDGRGRFGTVRHATAPEGTASRRLLASAARRPVNVADVARTAGL